MHFKKNICALTLAVLVAGFGQQVSAAGCGKPKTASLSQRVTEFVMPALMLGATAYVFYSKPKEIAALFGVAVADNLLTEDRNNVPRSHKGMRRLCALATVVGLAALYKLGS